MSVLRILLFCFVGIIVTAVLAAYLFLRSMRSEAAAINAQNEKAVAPVLAALDAYKAENGHYPESAALLHPRFLRTLPEFGPGTRMRYLASEDGSQFWVAVDFAQPHLLHPADKMHEYDSSSRTWAVKGWETTAKDDEQWDELVRK